MRARALVGPLWFGVVMALNAGCASTPPYEPTVKATEPWVYLHLLSHRSAVLQRLMDDDWTHVCRAPCNAPVPASGRFRVLGDVASQPFSMPGVTGNTVALRMDPDGSVYTLDSTRSF